MNEWKAFPFPVPSLASGVANKILAPLAALVCVAFEKALARRGTTCPLHAPLLK